MNRTISKQYMAILTGFAAMTGALVGLFLDMTWYVELPIAVAGGLLVGFLAATIVEAL